MTITLGDHVVTVVRTTSSGSDPYGNPVGGTPASSDVSGCSVQPMVGQEAVVGRDTIVSRWALRAPLGTDLLATDQVRFDGDTYEVDGEVQRWDFPELGHVFAVLRRSHS